jgi:hypothetical protein
MSMAESLKITKVFQGAANAVDCDYINMENYLKGWFVVVHTGAADTDLVLTLYESDDVAGTSTSAITTACPLWVDTDMGTSSDTLVATTAAYSYTIDTGNYPNQMVVWEIDPAILTDGYPCVQVADSGGNASNVCTVLFMGVPRYPQATLPTSIA